MLFLLVSLVSIAQAILCPQLSARHLSRGQAFQLPIYEGDNVEEVFMLLSVLKLPPWNLTTSYESSTWVYFEQHNWTQIDLLKAFGCL